MIRRTHVLTFHTRRSAAVTVAAVAATMLAVLQPFAGALNARIDAAAAATLTVQTASTATENARAVRARLYPQGATEAVIALEANSTVFAQAVAYAAVKRIPVLSSPTGTDPGPVISDAKALGATDLVLYGSRTTFTTSYISALATNGFTTAGSIIGDSPTARSVAGARSVPAVRGAVTVIPNDSYRLNLAYAYAANTRRHLLVTPENGDIT